MAAHPIAAHSSSSTTGLAAAGASSSLLAGAGRQRAVVAGAGADGCGRRGAGLALQEVRRFEEAIIAYERDIGICAELGNRYGQAQTLENLGVERR